MKQNSSPLWKRWLSLSLCVVMLASLISCEEEVELPSPEPVTLQWYMNFSWFDKSWGTDAVSAYISEKTGISVNYVVPSGGESQYMQQFLPGGITVDLITMESGDPYYGDFLSKGYLASLTELAQDCDVEFLEYIHPSTVQWYQQNGELYVYPNASYPLESNQGYSNQSFLVRKDIYEGIGSPDMSSPEGFLQALQDAVEYCPTVGLEPLIPLGFQEFTTTGNYGLEEYLENFLAIPYEIDGQVIDRFTHPEKLRWLETFWEAGSLGLLPQEIFLDKRVQMEEKIAQGRYFALLFQWSDCSEQLQQRNLLYPEERYIAVDGPKNSNGDDHTLASSSIQGWTITGISSNSPHQEEAMELMSFLLSDEGQRLIFLGLEGLTYTMEDGVPVFTEKAESLFFKNRGSFDEIHGGVSTHWPMMNNIYGDSMGYVLPEQEYFQELKQWSVPYTQNFSLYTLQELNCDSPAYFIQQADASRRGELLLSLLLADTREEFHLLWEEYLLWQEQHDYALLMEEKQAQLEENKLRLGQS